MKGTMLSFIEMVRGANSEEDVNSLLEIMNPSDDPNEMGEKYEEVLGYNPITYFDEVKVRKIMESVCERYPDISFDIDGLVKDVNEAVAESREQIIVQYVHSAVIGTADEEDNNIDSIVKNIIAEKLNVSEEYVSSVIGEFDDDDEYIDDEDELDDEDIDDEKDFEDE